MSIIITDVPVHTPIETAVAYMVTIPHFDDVRGHWTFVCENSTGTHAPDAPFLDDTPKSARADIISATEGAFAVEFHDPTGRAFTVYSCLSGSDIISEEQYALLPCDAEGNVL